MNTSEQTSASKREPGYYKVKLGMQWHEVYFNGQQWEFTEVDSLPSPQQQPDTTLDNPNLEQLIKAMFPAHNYGTSNKQKVANATSTAGQPDELSKAQARIRELEAENEQLRSERDKMREALEESRDVVITVMAVIEEDAYDSIRAYKVGNDFLRKASTLLSGGSKQ